MKKQHLSGWLDDHPFYRESLAALVTPLTSTQLARRLSQTQARCGRWLRRLEIKGLARCVNPRARGGRVYALTFRGHRCRRGLPGPADKETGDTTPLSPREAGLLGWASFRHRSAVLKILSEPMRAVAIRRRAIQSDDRLRMSANNVRGVLREMIGRRIARRIVGDAGYPHYELTPLGRRLQEALWRAEGLT